MKKTLFVADNNELDLRILRLILVRNPVFSRELYFKDGISLLRYLKSNFNDAINLPDIIFLEITMPGGWQVLEFLKINYAHLVKPIAVYVVSSSVNAGGLERGRVYHFVKEFIPKPIYLDKLTDIAQETGDYRPGLPNIHNI